MRLKTKSVAVTRWLLVALRRRVPERASAVPAPRLGGPCFGPMTGRDEFALKGFVAADDRARMFYDGS